MQEEQDKKKSSRKKPQSFLGELFEWVKILLVAGIAAFLLNNYVIANSTIPTGSMENTIMTGNRIIGNRLQYKFSDPKRGDIVIFKFPDNEKKYFRARSSRSLHAWKLQYNSKKQSRQQQNKHG